MATKKFILAALMLVFLFSACGDDSSGQDVVSITDKTISGVSQKGPFVKGSAVKLYELDGETIAQTGKSFTGKIASDDGKFTVSSVSLVSQYALLEANGYFRNEITGDKSSGTITLNALTDLRNREKVNINLLTHLEYERALYLVGTGDNVSEAKNQAEAEILNAFGIEGDFDNSEDLDIFSSGDGNAALLAFSVLMLGDLSEADLTERLTSFATDIETDGRWDDETAKTVIADWASGKSLDGELAEIRNNIASWKLSDEVPVFEKYIDNFWWQIFGLGPCDENSNGKVLQNLNSQSKTYGDYFICDNNAWRVATALEYDTYKWVDPTQKNTAKDGDLKNGSISGKIYKYDEVLNKWTDATALDLSLNLVCTTKNAGITTEDQTKLCTPYGWFCLTEWCWDTKREYYLNPEIIYGEMTDPRDKKTYRTVTIGNDASAQTWMAENLNYKLSDRSICFNNNDTYCDMSGRYYTWNDAQDVCPEGWHIPSLKEWNTLFDNAGYHNQDIAAANLISQKGWATVNGVDSFGFGALPMGYKFFDNENFSGVGAVAYFWSSNEGMKGEAECSTLSLFMGEVTTGGCTFPENTVMSVRCIKDDE